ncbi:type II toxin-antitoxin system Phd/YefM family antitoxin [Nocardioides sp. KC13]|uniref:Type II toxin-antitoxin system Phd/YefM family antitoxin n=1 Tax=Nocardioides turkmenicus TaxID=2711220 RepID=A0A6M1QX35_9ACTN|nr:type II toxin-antitoxin system Phd/YefM family antitoxin [Nocardioides sp. KC13]NGN92484.1 type II toxin-antitoxin system Phd/YefM family antitoxin [Nocardioides sp. KC13]
MTELNQRISAVTRAVIEDGESFRVTNGGRAVLRLVPEVQWLDNPVEALVNAGLATPPKRPHRHLSDRSAAALSAELDEVNGAIDL